VSDDRSTVSIGVGNRWGAVNDALDALDLATPGGRISGVGVGGFTSGRYYTLIVRYFTISANSNSPGGMSFNLGPITHCRMWGR
jgi:hypothetical protein